MTKRILIGACTVIGVFVLAEWIMPGHWDRLEMYMMGNIDALMSNLQ